MSMWRTPEWADFVERFGATMIHFDQGVMGHPVRKPTTMGVILPALQQLDGMRGGPQKLPEVDRTKMTMREKCQHSKSWASWAPGLKAAVATALRQWLRGMDRSSVVGNRGSSTFTNATDGGRLAPLGPVALNQWREHYMNDHYPSRRDCRQCVQAAGRGKPHKRVNHPESYTLSVDLSGKLTEGFDQNGQPAHFPVDRHGRALLEPLDHGEAQDQPLPDPDEPIDGVTITPTTIKSWQ